MKLVLQTMEVNTEKVTSHLAFVPPRATDEQRNDTIP